MVGNVRSSQNFFLSVQLIVQHFILLCCRYDPDHHKNKNCRYNNNKGYVVFSAMGSFFIPLTVMVYVYARISCVVAQRHNQLTALDSNDQVQDLRFSWWW